MADPLLNTQLGKYTLLEQLGSGGMGAVYRSNHPQLNRPVAIKVVLGNATPEARQRFLREAQMAMQLSHPNIVRVFDVDEHNGLPYIVMELIDGPSLVDELQNGKIDLDRGLKIGAELADALDYAHKQGILHRDIKPANVLIRKNGTTVLVDLGLARLQNVAQDDHLTQSGMIIGTLAYMAPEQIQAQPLDARTDVYALGVLLFRMVTGKLPFEGDTAQMMFGHVYTPPPDPRTTGVMIPPALSSLILAMLAKDPNQRPQTMTEIAQMLRRIQQDPAVSPTYGAYTGDTMVRPQPTSPMAYPQQQYGWQQPSNQYPQQQYGWQPSNQHSNQTPTGIPTPPMQMYAPPKRRGPSAWFIASFLMIALVGGISYFVIQRAFNNDPKPPKVVLGLPTPPPPIRPTATTGIKINLPTPAVNAPTQAVEATSGPDEQNLVTANVRTRAIDNTTWFNGTITNQGNAPREQVKITIVLRDKDGKELDHEDGYVGLGFLAPGQKAGWTVLFSRNLPAYDHFDIEVRSSPEGFQTGYAYRELKIDEGHELFNDGLFSNIRGTVTNTGEARAKFVQIYVTAYDEEGNVLYVGSSFAEDDLIIPGGTSRFEVPLLIVEEKVGKIVSYDVFVEGAKE